VVGSSRSSSEIVPGTSVVAWRGAAFEPTLSHSLMGGCIVPSALRLPDFLKAGFSDPQLEKEFLDRYFRSTQTVFRVTLGSAALVYAIFGIWDSRGIQLIFRFFVAVPALLILFGLTFADAVKTRQNVLVFALAIIGSILVATQLILYGELSPYNMGSGSAAMNFSLVEVFVLAFLPTRFVTAITVGLIVFSIYIIAAASFSKITIIELANYSFNIWVIYVILCSVSYSREMIYRSEFLRSVRERDTLHRQREDDAQYLSWLRQLARFLRHEVRLPVAQITTSIELLKAACADRAELTPLFLEATRGAEHVWNLIERAGRATDIEAFVRQGTFVNTDLSRLMRDLVENSSRTLTGVNFRFEDRGSIEIEIDPILLREALSNILSNAASFADEDSTINVEIKVDENTVSIAVDNQGPLIQHDGQQLFGAFTSTRSEPSSEHQGLGLYLVKLVAQRHGGNATIENMHDGSGVRVIIEIPMFRNTGLPASLR
jgi:signal transduction histidine kinase